MSNLDRNTAVEFCHEIFGVRLASSSFAIKHLQDVVDEGVEEAQVWTGIFRRGKLDSEWRSLDGDEMNVTEVINESKGELSVCEGETLEMNKIGM